MRQMRERVMHFDSRYWARSFIADLAAREPSAGSPVEGDDATHKIIDSVRRPGRRGLFLDYDGTLREFEDDPDAAAPTDDITRLLTRLASEPNLDVCIISGRKRTDLERWFGPLDITLVAEHGSCYRRPGEREWHDMNPMADLSWKTQVLEVFRHYEGSTPGSWVEEKHPSVVWHYRRSDPEFGKWKSSLLMGELMEILSNLPVEIHHGKAIVEVSSVHISKKVAVEHLLQSCKYALVVCAGDDQTDEGMFAVEHGNLISIKVGTGNTRAEYRVADPSHFRRLLNDMVKLGTTKRN